MKYIFSKSVTGYRHIKDNKRCQDFSLSYSDNERIIIACADGHGGDKYVRSHRGSKLACEAVINVFKSLSYKDIKKFKEDELERTIKLAILCEWNKLVELDYSSCRFKKSELVKLKPKQILELRSNPVAAYGTTLTGAFIIKNTLVTVAIGDSEVLLFRKGHLIKAFDNSDDPAGNITNSMCQSDAYQYLHVCVRSFDDFDGVLLCTDGLSAPYQSYVNFNDSFVKPMVKDLLQSKSVYQIDRKIDNIATSVGIGDDVSLSFVIKSSTPRKYYS